MSVRIHRTVRIERLTEVPFASVGIAAQASEIRPALRNTRSQGPDVRCFDRCSHAVDSGQRLLFPPLPYASDRESIPGKRSETG